MSFAHILASEQPLAHTADKAAVDSQAEEARIRTTLEINAFDLATLERYLILNAHIPNSIDEDDIRNAMYRLYERYLDQAPHFPHSPRLTELFNPYPYGDTFTDAGFGDTKAAREVYKQSSFAPSHPHTLTWH